MVYTRTTSATIFNCQRGCMDKWRLGDFQYKLADIRLLSILIKISTVLCTDISHYKDIYLLFTPVNVDFLMIVLARDSCFADIGLSFASNESLNLKELPVSSYLLNCAPPCLAVSRLYQNFPHFDWTYLWCPSLFIHGDSF